MASESKDIFSRIRMLHNFYFLINIFSMKNEVYMCITSMERKLGHQHGGINAIRLHNLINRNTNLCDPWSRTLEHNPFQTCWKLSESKTFNNYLCNISIQPKLSAKIAKEALAIKRIFSLVVMITKAKFSNSANDFKIHLFGK